MRTITFLISLLTATVADETGLFAPGSAWEMVSDGHRVAEGIASAAGDIFITDVPDGELFRISPDGSESMVDAKTNGANGLAIGPDGQLYGACMHKPVIAVWDPATGERAADITLPTPANDMAITADGHVFYTWGPANAVFRVSLENPIPVKAAELPNPNGITLSHDGGELWVGEFFGDTVRAYPILDDGRLGPPRNAFKAHVPDDGRGLLDGMTPLPDGRLLAGTALGLQILAENRPAVTLPNPATQRANYTRILTLPDNTRWVYATFVHSVMRRKAGPATAPPPPPPPAEDGK